jgi:hypothetical protein
MMRVENRVMMLRFNFFDMDLKVYTDSFFHIEGGCLHGVYSLFGFQSRSIPFPQGTGGGGRREHEPPSAHPRRTPVSKRKPGDVESLSLEALQTRPPGAEAPGGRWIIGRYPPPIGYRLL